MFKRLAMSLAAGAIFAASTSGAFAVAPMLQSMPDVYIGDQEDNIGTDNNLFVFTNAFQFDNYVNDLDTTVSDLIWSFDEYSPAANWFQINGKGPVLLGDTAIINEAIAGGPQHLNPGDAKNIRKGDLLVPGQTAGYASFRDIVLSPAGQNPPFYPTPTQLAEHGAGKLVRFYVSDTFQVVSTDVLVKTLDQGFDTLSPAFQFSKHEDDNFTTNIVGTGPTDPNGWQYVADAYTGQTGNYDATAQALRIATTAISATTWRSSYWMNNLNDWLPYAYVGPNRIVRSKWYVYAGGQSPSALNIIPNMRMKLQTGFAVSSTFELLTSDANARGSSEVAYANEDAPRMNASNPSLYRVDYDPIDVPALASNAQTAQSGAIRRVFEAYQTAPNTNGSIYLTESVIGTYPVAATPYSATPIRTMGITDLQNFAVGGYPLSGAFQAYYFAGITETNRFGTPTADSNISMTWASGVGAVFNSVALATDRVGAATADFFAIPKSTVVPSDYVTVPRVEPGKQYSVRFHVTSTQTTNQQAQMRMRARTNQYNWSQKFEVGGAWPSNSVVLQAVAQQSLPGVGSLNTGGWYNMIVHTPMSTEIQSSQPNLNGAPGPGVAGTGNTSMDNRRIIFVGFDLIDTLSSGANAYLEKGQFVVDQIEIRSYPLFAD